MAKGLDTTDPVYAGKGYVETHSGYFWLAKPEFRIADIAHALGNLCRFNGHVREFYSVAEHSVLVATLMDKLQLGNPFEGLLHDATEAYVSDVPAPLKQFLPDWRDMDKRMDIELRKQFELPAEMTPGCTEADWIAVFLEARALLSSRGTEFTDPFKHRPTAMLVANNPDFKIRCLLPEKATTWWEDHYEQYASPS